MLLKWYNIPSFYCVKSVPSVRERTPLSSAFFWEGSQHSSWFLHLFCTGLNLGKNSKVIGFHLSGTLHCVSPASLWDCFLLFLCPYGKQWKTKWDEGKLGSLWRNLSSIFIKIKKNVLSLCGGGTVQILIQELNDWTVYSILTMGPRCWIPRARCCMDSSWLQRFPGSPSHSSTPSPHLLLLKCSLNITPAPCYSCGTALCVLLCFDSREDLI